MFYSQRISNKKRRLGNASAFDQSWRTTARRPLSEQCDPSEPATEDAQLKRFSTPLPPQSTFEFSVAVPERITQVVAEKAEEPKGEDKAAAGELNAKEADELEKDVRDALESPKASLVQDLPQSPEVPWAGNLVVRAKHVPDVGEETAEPIVEEASKITKDDSVVLKFVHALRVALAEDRDEDEDGPAQQANPPTQPPPDPKSDTTTRHDSVIPPQPPQHPLKRPRRPSFNAHRSGSHTNLLTLRTSIQQISRNRTMDRPEVSLRSEMQRQREYLSRNKRNREKPAYRTVKKALERNRGHLVAYQQRRGAEGVESLPESVRVRMGCAENSDVDGEERESYEGDVVVVAHGPQGEVRMECVRDVSTEGALDV